MNQPNFHSHAAHSKPGATEELPLLIPPSQRVHPDSPQVHALLEHLDDVIFAAVRGDKEALEEAHTLWPQIVQTLGWELLEESREQYLRYAVEITRSDNLDQTRSPENAISALEILSLLTKS